MKKVAVILSGCGAMDGSEIREGVCLLLSLSQLGVEYNCFSIDKEQTFVCNHKTEKKTDGEKRNVLVESARLARGKVQEVSLLKPEEFDGIAFVGGYGAAVNLSDFAVKNSFDFTIEPKIESVIMDFYNLKKPMYFLCVSPVIIAKLLPQAKITLGGKNEVSEAVKNHGINLVEKTKNEPVFDEKLKIITIPCYMLNITLAELYKGIYAGAQKLAEIL